ncbi:hypothetical protein BABINDRAFT_58443 [Babjeviella inositovora NRRL Y-12698]|uniref:AP complex subunit beta n=1 Tax=Babjeviella inositovora NRRL Y-12698 TaxID=984486 RepID=A0A1E3QVT9_9ASCO|nr:uncharacterized protein BABINDRAFT_58443 [Babjeviella inositovora NRRL Y-12698]ODQ81779.1 hypothetical protein BABINDRAFT_58443 [Babjeviella inositovora NRRL Y-12698]
MSDAKCFTRLKASEIKTELETLVESKKANGTHRLTVRRQILKKIIANINLNNSDMVHLFPEVVDTVLTEPYASDLACKKMCYKYFEAFGAARPEGTLMCLPSMLRELTGTGDAYARSLILRCLAGIPLKQVAELLAEPIRGLISDEDPLVRKTACFAISKLYDCDAKLAARHNLIGLLNDRLYDENSHVVASALASLSEITEKNNTMKLVVNDSHARNLLTVLHRCNEWSQCYIISALTAYVPQLADDALFVVEKLVPLLRHANTAIVLNALKCIIYLSNYVEDITDAMPVLPKRLGNAMVSLIAKQPELQFLALRNVILVLLSKPHLLDLDVKMFFCKYDDTLYVKDTKLEIIYLLANAHNLKIVLKELEEYATEVDVTMARKAVRAIGNLAIKLPRGANACVQLILDLVAVDLPHITQEAVVVFKNVLRKYPREFDSAIQTFIKYTDLAVTALPSDANPFVNHHAPEADPDAVAAIVWILGQYCATIDGAVTILDRVTRDFLTDTIDVQLITLTAVTKVFLQLPSKDSEALLIARLKLATEEVDNPDLRERGFFYWRLLSSFPQDASYANAKQIVMNKLPVISTDSDKLDVAILEELELNIGTLASIYLKPVKQVFRLARTRILPQSACLVRKPRPVANDQHDALTRKISPINNPDLRANLELHGSYAGRAGSRDDFSRSDDDFVESFRETSMSSSSSLGLNKGIAAIGNVNRSLTRTGSMIGRKLTLKKN